MRNPLKELVKLIISIQQFSSFLKYSLNIFYIQIKKITNILQFVTILSNGIYFWGGTYHTDF